MLKSLKIIYVNYIIRIKFMNSQSLYINTIDECVNNIIDTYYLDVIDNKKIKNQITNESYIFDNYNDINKTINEINMSNIKKYKLDELIENKNDFNNVVIMLKEYLMLYFFFYIGTIIGIDKNINLLNKINNKYKLNVSNNRYLSQYVTYQKMISDYNFVLSNIDKFNLDGKNPNSLSQTKTDKKLQKIFQVNF